MKFLPYNPEQAYLSINVLQISRTVNGSENECCTGHAGA